MLNTVHFPVIYHIESNNKKAATSVYTICFCERARVCVCLHCATVDKQYFSPIARRRKTAVFLSFQHTTNNKTHLQTNGGKKCTYNEEAVARIKYNISSHLKICNCFKRKECTHTHTHYTTRSLLLFIICKRS